MYVYITQKYVCVCVDITHPSSLRMATTATGSVALRVGVCTCVRACVCVCVSACPKHPSFEPPALPSFDSPEHGPTHRAGGNPPLPTRLFYPILPLSRLPSQHSLPPPQHTPPLPSLDSPEHGADHERRGPVPLVGQEVLDRHPQDGGGHQDRRPRQGQHL